MSHAASRSRVHTGSHWGVYDGEVEDGRLMAVRPFEKDPYPPPPIAAMPSAVDHESRIMRPMVRRGYLERGPSSDPTGRGVEPFVLVSWDEALDLRVCSTRDCASAAAAHQVDYDDPDHRLTGLRQQFIILAQPSVAIQSAEGPLDNPARGDDLKPLGRSGPLGDLQTHGPVQAQPLDPRYQLPRIGLVGPDGPQSRTLVPQDHEQALGAIAVLHIGGRNDDGQDQPEGIDENVPLAPFDLLVDIETAAPPFSVVFTD
jgi:hypothetical protein